MAFFQMSLDAIISPHTFSSFLPFHFPLSLTLPVLLLCFPPSCHLHSIPISLKPPPWLQLKHIYTSKDSERISSHETEYAAPVFVGPSCPIQKHYTQLHTFTCGSHHFLSSQPHNIVCRIYISLPLQQFVGVPAVFISFLNFIYLLRVYVLESLCHRTQVKATGQLVGINSLITRCVSQFFRLASNCLDLLSHVRCPVKIFFFEFLILPYLGRLL